MISQRLITIFILISASLTAFAERKMTVRNAESGESFEVSVPDGLKIYEYNSNWLDSIPYLLERARYGEPWAYEALGDCYRDGKGGVDRSVFKTFFYYELGGVDIEKKALESITENHKEPLSLVLKLVAKVEAGDNDGILCLVDTLNQEQYYEADILRDIINGTDTLSFATVVERNIMSAEVSADKMMFTVLGCVTKNWFPASLNKKEWVVAAIGEKIPYLYDKTAVDFFCKSHEGMDPDTIARKSATAITFLEKADKEGMLSRKGAAILYRHYVSEVEAGRMGFDGEEMKRLAIVAGLPEDETFIFTDNE